MCCSSSPRCSADTRGFFFESFNQKAFNEATGLDVNFVQGRTTAEAPKACCAACTTKCSNPRASSVRVVRGAVFDCGGGHSQGAHRPLGNGWAWSFREGQPLDSFGCQRDWHMVFLVLSESADFLYKTTDYYAPALNGASAGTTIPCD